LIERHAPRIVQHEYGAVPVTSSFDRSGRPGRIQLFSQRIFVLQSFQSFRRGILRRWRKYQNLGVALLTCGTIKVKVFVPPSASRIYFESSITDRLQLSVIYTILSLISLPKIREHMIK
jgi:hypothetical protein